MFSICCFYVLQHIDHSINILMNFRKKLYKNRSDGNEEKKTCSRLTYKRNKDKKNITSLDMTEMSRVNACNRFIDGNEVMRYMPQTHTPIR